MPSTLIFNQMSNYGNPILLGILCFVLIALVLYYVFKIVELRFALKYKKLFYNHFYLNLRKLNTEQKAFLQNEFTFYKKLSKKEQKYFEHRVDGFINKLSFVGRDNLQVTAQMQVLISATAAMLTFGFRTYLIKTIDKILIYPGEYYSNITKQYHKGEFNPKLKMIVLSWEDFLKGYEISNDNLNLGMHEMGHAIHLNSLKQNDISAVLFKKTFLKLTDYLQKNEDVRKKVIETKYFRAYAFTNHYEFISVLIETFYETPSDFRYQFPEIYKYLKEMLNFNYSDY